MYSFPWLSRHTCLDCFALTHYPTSLSSRRFASSIPVPQYQQATQKIISYFVHKCKHIDDLSSGRDLHCHAICSGLNRVSILGDYLIRMFSTLGSMFEMSLAFCVIEKPSVYTWHAAIAAHFALGQHDRALDLYVHVQQEGICTGRVTYLCILKACANAGASWQGMLVHHQISSCGIDIDVVIGTTLIDVYSKCGALEDAQHMLDTMADPNVASYNAFGMGCAQHGQWFLVFKIFSQMKHEGIEPNKVTYTSLLKACNSIGGLHEGKLIHNIIVNDGCHTDSIIVSSLVDMYAKCGCLQEAAKVFGQLQEHDVMAWNAMIAGYVQHNQGFSAMVCFEKMQAKGKLSDAITYASMAKACGITKESGLGRIIHDQIIREGFEGDLAVANMLTDMYARFGCLDDAVKVFNTIPCVRDIVSWGAIITGYIQLGHVLQAVEALDKMQLEGLAPTKALILAVLNACSCCKAMKYVKLLHEQIRKVEVELDVSIGSALIDAYSKCGDLDEAHAVFDEIKSPDAVCWNAIITGYAQNGPSLIALYLFEKMQFQGVEPDNTTLSSTLKACGCIGAVKQGRLIHHKVAESGEIADSILDNTLVDMYARCGALEDARIMLDSLPYQNVRSWGALIAGYAQHGECVLAEQCLIRMQQQGIKPDEKVFTSMLAACSHAGWVTEASECFESMQNVHCITPDLQHFNCMIDLLASMGWLKEAEGLIEEMTIQPDVTGWMSLLAACRRYGDVGLGRRCFDGVFRLDASVAAAYMIMSDIYADKNLWHDMQKTLELQRREGAWKKPATAWIEVNNGMWEFCVGGKDYKGCIEISEKASRVKKCMLKDKAYLPQLDLVFESVLEGVDRFYPCKVAGTVS